MGGHGPERETADPDTDAALVIDGDLPAPSELQRLVREARPRQRMTTEMPKRLGLARRAAVWLVLLYQQALSPRLRRRCLLEPSCSRYAELAVAENGVLRGGLETWQRLRRCRPQNEGIIDYPKGVRFALPSDPDRSCVRR